MLIKQDFYLHTLDARRPLHIRVPDTGEAPFPVMYFFDGHNLFRDEDATYGRSWGLDAYCAAWDKPLIIVGVECAHEGNMRISEYLPYRSGWGWLRGIEPRGDLTMRALIDEIKPWVDSAFPTIPFRECTAVGGSSMGGLMAAYALVRYNRYFSKAACLSPSLSSVSGHLWHDMNSEPMSPDSRIYLSWGTQEGYGGVKDPWQEDRSSRLYRTCRTTADKVIRSGGAARLFCQVGGRHCEEDWEKQLPLFMPFLWQE